MNSPVSAIGSGLPSRVVSDQAAVEEHSIKPVAVQAAVVSRQLWQHTFGQMLIETCADGSVWIDGKPVPETLVRVSSPSTDPAT